MKEKNTSKLRVLGFFLGFAVIYFILLAVINHVNWDNIYIFTKRPAVVETTPKKAEVAKAEVTKPQSKLQLRLEAIRRETAEALALHHRLLEKFSQIDQQNWLDYAPTEYAKTKAFINLISTYSPARLRLVSKDIRAITLKMKLTEKRVAKLVKEGAPKKIAEKGKTVGPKDKPVAEKKEIVVKEKPKPKYTPEQLELIKKIAATKTVNSVKKKQKAPAIFMRTTRNYFNLLQKIKLYKGDSFASAYRRLFRYLETAPEYQLSPKQDQQIASIKNKAEELKERAGEIAYNLIGLTPVEKVKPVPTNMPASYLNAAKLQQNQAEKAGYPLEVENLYGMRFRFIPAGTFIMGSPQKETDRKGDEKLHKVVISKPFYMQTTEISVNHFRIINDKNDSVAKSKVSWKEAINFCKKLNLKENMPTDLYSLPSEAMWEYACRAGSTEATYLPDLDKIAVFGNAFSGKVEKRGRKLPNAWGIYDMLGNVKELCLDRGKSTLFFSRPPKTYVDGIKDPLEEKGGSVVVRGGGWGSSKSKVRAASRELIHEESKEWDVGFRVIRLLP